jgi:hypothetical protein
MHIAFYFESVGSRVGAGGIERYYFGRDYWIGSSDRRITCKI